MKKIAIILCGGSGSRLWPLSTSGKPKQFLKLMNHKTLIENTIERIPQEYSKIFVSNKNFKDEIRKYITKDDTVIYESCAKNTGQALCLTILKLKELFSEDCNILVIPCDHMFDMDKFRTSIDIGMSIINNSNIVTFGIKPTYPETGFGYIKKRDDNSIDHFREKPNLEKAIEYINDGCLWNSGIFMFRLNHMYNLYSLYNKDSNDYCKQSLESAVIINNEIFISDIYEKTLSISFDFLIMEKIKEGIVIEYNGLWSDIGDWKGIHDFFFKNEGQNEKENKTIGDNIVAIDTENSFIYSDKGKTIVIGLNNIVIVKSDDNLLIMNKDYNNEFKQYIQTNL